MPIDVQIASSLSNAFLQLKRRHRVSCNIIIFQMQLYVVSRMDCKMCTLKRVPEDMFVKMN